MAAELWKQLRDVGTKLQNPPPTKDALIKLLKQAGTCLLELDQLSSKSMLELMQPFPNSIVKPEFLKHQDRDIKLLVATCICELTRITAPEAPYSDDVLREIFRLIVATFSGLSDTSGPSFGRRVAILETLARYRSCVVMLDLECDDLVNEMFSTFFSVVSDDHSENVRSSMKTVMVVLLEESEEIHEDLVLILLSVLGRNKKGVGMAARRLAMNVIKNCAVKLEPGIKKFLVSSISGDSRALNHQIDYHEVIYDIYGCAPQILLGITPYLTGELVADRLDTRMKAVSLIGDLFAMTGSSVSEAFRPIFSEFLKRLSDRVVEIRISVLEHAKICLLSNPSRAEAPQIISSLCDRLLDYDENVRKQVVAVVCDVTCHAPGSIPIETLKLVAERLRDKTLLVKKYTMERLAEIHKHYCLGVSDGSINPSECDWILGKILRCLYDKDLRSDTIESILCGSLFPTGFSVKDKVGQWVRAFSGFDKVEVKALEKILEQKQRLQQEMQRYLSLRQMHQDADATEFQKKVLFCFRVMSRCFTDFGKAEENFQILDQLKDSNVWKILSALPDPNSGFLQACIWRNDLLRIVGEKHRLYDFLGALSIKCSYLLFDKEHVKEILLEACRQKSAGCTQLVASCMNLLVTVARFCPLLLNGTEENLVHLLNDDNEVIKEGVLHVLAKAGGSIREQLGASSSSVELMLDRICLEGSRRQAKYAVHALAAITKDDGLKALSVLYKRLVDMLEEKLHLPAVLQSLGCIAETAMPVFETRESEIEELIRRMILKCSNKSDDKKVSWDDRSELCSLKIFSIKALVKSYLPVREAHLRIGINKLIEILKRILSFGEISQDIKSSLVDKAHLRLASAKAILRLSRCWDHQIPVDVFHLTLRTAEICFPQARKLFLNKVYQYTKDRLLDAKYTCAFLFGMVGSQKLQFEEDKHKLADIIQACQQAKARQLPTQSDAKSVMAYPENILPYFIHTLAHHSSFPDVEKCKDIKAFELTYRQLELLLSMLVHGTEDGKLEASSDNNKETISVIISIFRSVKHCEDAVDPTKTKNSHAICDLGLLITKHLAGKKDNVQSLAAPVSLPPVLYKTRGKKEDADPLVSDEKSWMADENLWSHLPLKLDSDETLHAEIANGQISIDSEGYGNEVPLSKILKHLKAQGSKARKKVKSKASLPGTTDALNNVDILKMVREINLDSLGTSNKFESANGHGIFLTTTEVDEQHQKRRKDSDTMSILVPKRPRSSSAQPAFRSSPSMRSSKGLLQASNDFVSQTKTSSFQPFKSEAETLANLGDKLPSVQKSVANLSASDMLVSCFRKNSSMSSKVKDQGSNKICNDVKKVGGIENHDLKLNPPAEPDRIKASSDLKPMVPVKKRKRRSIAGLAKCSTMEIGSHATSLINCRIKVWWPMDKQFYEGVVKSYDPKHKKHTVLYDDGDVEVLYLDKERWELIDGFQKPSKRPRPSMCSPSKEASPKECNFIRDAYQNERLSKILRGKRTPRKNLKHGLGGISKSKTANDLYEARREECSDVSTSTCKRDDKISGEFKEEQKRDVAVGVESNAEEKGVCEEKQMVDSDGIERVEEGSRCFPSGKKQVEDVKLCMDLGSHSGEAKPSVSGGTSSEESDEDPPDLGVEECSIDLDELERKMMDCLGSHHHEASDNETLGMWRRRARKSAAGVR